MLRKLGWLLAILMLLATGCIGIYNGTHEWADARTVLQQSVTGGVFLYGVVGLLAGIGLALRRRWSFPAAVVWGVIVTYVPGAAVIGYGGADTPTSAAIVASAGSALIAAFVVWVAHYSTRPLAPSPRHPEELP